MALMVQYMQGWAWRPDRDMKGWSPGGQPDLIENQDDGPNLDNEDFREQSIFVCFFVISVGNGENMFLFAVDVICP